MKVLVTGATGCLGGGAARRLAAAGHDVLGTGRDLEAGKRLAADGVRFQAADLRDSAALLRLARGAEVVVHCAARSGLWGPSAEFEADNVRGTEHVLAACATAGTRRLVHVSTPSVYARTGARLPLGEDAPLTSSPENAYVRTKLEAERRVRAAAATGLETVVLRPRAIYGPGDRIVLPRLVCALAAGRLPRIGDPDTLMDLTFVGNAVDALVLAVQAGDAAVGRTFNVTNGEPVRIWPLIDALADQLGLARPTRHVARGVAQLYAGGLELVHHTLRRSSEPLFTRASVRMLTTSMTLDISAAREHLGYEPRISTEEGLHRFVAWWGSRA